MEEKISLFSIGIKELLSNFTPAYIAILLLLFLTDRINDVSYAATLFLLAGLLAISLSAIQPFVLRVILYPGILIQRMIKGLIKQNLSGRKVNVQNLQNIYLYLLKESFSNFLVKKGTITGTEQQIYEIKQSRLLLYFYLFLLFSLIFCINIYERLSNIVIFHKINDISNNISGIDEYTPIFFLVFTFIFLLGFYYELTRFKNMILAEFPLFSASRLKKNEEEIKYKINYLNNNKNKHIEIYEELITKYKIELRRSQILDFEKDWYFDYVKTREKIPITTLMEISESLIGNLKRDTKILFFSWFLMFIYIISFIVAEYFGFTKNVIFILILETLSLLSIMIVIFYIKRSFPI